LDNVWLLSDRWSLLNNGVGKATLVTAMVCWGVGATNVDVIPDVSLE